MPNWCSCDIAIEGPKEQLDALEHFLSRGAVPLDFNLFFPYPQKFKDLDTITAKAEADGIPWDKLPKDGFNQGGYEWCIENWGTKWLVQDATKERTSDYTMSLWFDTANSAPLPIIERMSEIFPMLIIELNYEVEGYGYRHSVTYKAGDVSDATSWEINEDEEE